MTGWKCRADNPNSKINLAHRCAVAFELDFAWEREQQVGKGRPFIRVKAARILHRDDGRRRASVPGDEGRMAALGRFDERRKLRLRIANLHGLHHVTCL
jgi:hypothetical protein